MKMLNPLLLASLLIAGIATAQELTWTGLAGRPELWPAQCTVKAAINFEGGVSIPAGTKVDVVDFNGDQADLKTIDGRTYFAAGPDDSDVLEVARAAYAGITPKQRALTYPLREHDDAVRESHH
jgi:hypothetical protein